MYMPKNSKLLNTESATVLSCTLFSAVLPSVTAYERTFNVIYNVPGASSAFIPHALKTTNDRYIRVARFCIASDELLPFVAKLNARVLLNANKSSRPIGLIHLSYPQVHRFRPVQILICVVRIWYALNGTTIYQKPGGLSTSSFETYAILAIITLGDLICTVDHRCRGMKDLVAT